MKGECFKAGRLNSALSIVRRGRAHIGNEDRGKQEVLHPSPRTTCAALAVDLQIETSRRRRGGAQDASPQASNCCPANDSPFHPNIPTFSTWPSCGFFRHDSSMDLLCFPVLACSACESKLHRVPVQISVSSARIVHPDLRITGGRRRACVCRLVSEFEDRRGSLFDCGERAGRRRGGFRLVVKRLVQKPYLARDSRI
jgi:hypothetical protein